MGTSSNIIQLCRSMANIHGSSCLQVEARGVSWKLFVRQGQLQYATHSLQTLETLVNQLTRLGHTLSAAAHTDLAASIAVEQSGLGLLHGVEQLEKQGVLMTEGSRALKLALAKHALEPLLWLSEAQQHSSPYQLDSVELSPMSTILDELELRLQGWQRLQPVIASPYQQISCPDPNRLSQPMATGQLSQALLMMLSRVIQGNNLEQVACLLKQDSLKVAQLLYPYIQQKIFVLTPPITPLDKLPLIPASAFAKKSEVAPSSSVLGKAPKIVCIDDSQAMLDTLQKYLEADGFDVATVDNPMKSMSTLFAMKPDMILMDISMPGINGRRLCEILRRSSAFKELPIIIVSSNTSVLAQTKAELSGATDYLQKPFSRVELLSMVKTYLKTATAV